MPPKKTIDPDDKTVIVSVRMPAELLERAKAYAAVTGDSTNQVIRNAAEWHVDRLSKSPEFRAHSKSYLERTLQTLDVVFGKQIPQDVLAALNTLTAKHD